MKKRYWLILIILAGAAVGGYLLAFGRPSQNTAQYELAPIARGTVENTVSATGTLTPLTTVEVGTQVSGTVATVYVDFNDQVKEGQILAVLDTTQLWAAVLDAQANLERADALVQQAQADYDRNKSLYDGKLESEAEFLPFQIALKSQFASRKSAEVALQRAQRNLQYAVIRSPITGIVISRNVEAGQTVAASLSTPTLFVIAQDLSRMEILAEVDESDIGQVAEGQAVRFVVTAYPDKKFTGKVKQIRLQPQTVSNVVTYTVVVEATNAGNLLLPGMTASLDIVTDQRDSVLLVSNKALRYTPDPEVVAAFREKQRQRFQELRNGRGGRADSALATGRAGQGMGQFPTGGNRERSGSMVWFLDSLGQLSGAPFRPGLSDGTNTEILAGRMLKEGTQVIIGLKESSSGRKAGTRTESPGGFRPFGRGL